MLTLDPLSSCDICAESYTTDSLPHSIPCGHTFCKSCLAKICEGIWSPRIPPACPMCREPFAEQNIRMIRVDMGIGDAHPSSTLATEMGRAVYLDEESRVRAEAKRLEDKVSKAAAKRCTFEEVSALQTEIEDWLNKELIRRPDSQHASLRLSAALLGAILVNGFAYNEAKKFARGVEVSLKDKLEAVELIKKKLEIDLQRQRQEYTEKVWEVQQLKNEMSKLKTTTAINPLVARAATPLRASSATPPPGRIASSPLAQTQTPHYSTYSHFPRQHSLSSSKPVTVPSINSALANSSTNAPLASSAPVINRLTSGRSRTPGPPSTLHRTAAAERPSTPLFNDRHERWLPSSDSDTPAPKYPSSSHFSHPRPSSSMAAHGWPRSSTPAF